MSGGGFVTDPDDDDHSLDLSEKLKKEVEERNERKNDELKEHEEEIFNNDSTPLDQSEEESEIKDPAEGISQDPVDVAIRQRVLELYLPPHNKKIKEIALLLNRSRSFIYYRIQELVALGFLKKNEETGHIIRELPESQIDGYADVMKTEFNKYKSVERWVTKMKRDKIKNWAYQVTDLFKICKTLERNPDHFLAPLELVEQLMEDFEEKFRNGEAYYIDKQHKALDKNRADVSIGHFVKAVRSFRQRLGHPVPKNVGGILSVTEDTGNYARLKMTDSQIAKGVEYMNRISQTIGDLFIIHHETGVRTDTLFNMMMTFRHKIIEVLNPKTGERKPCELYILDVHEKKTEGDYSKIIISPHARKVIKRMKQGQTMVEKGDWKSKKEYNQHLKNFYKSIGLIVGEEHPKKGTQEYYLNEYPSHFIRHSWSHWLMRCTGFNATVVSKFAWEDTKTLTKIYSKQSIDEILSIGDCQFCRPSKYRKADDDLYFCCLQHAIAYYNEQLPPELSDDKSDDDQPPTSPVTNSVDPDPSGNSEFEKTTVNLGEGKVDSLPDNPVMLIPS
jgi:predicted transcriptional regulator